MGLLSSQPPVPPLELGSANTPSDLGDLTGLGGGSSSLQGPGSKVARSSLLELPGEFDMPAFTFDDELGIIDDGENNAAGGLVGAAEGTIIAPVSAVEPAAEEVATIQVRMQW